MLSFLGLTSLILLIALSAWISAAEMGVTSLSKFRVKKLIAQNPKLSDPLRSWLKSPYYLLTVILTINVIADMLVSFIAAGVSKDILHTVNRHIVEVFSLIITSFVLLVFAEIVPKFYARSNSEKITVFSIPLLDKTGKILKPLFYPIIKLTEILSPKTSAVSSLELNETEVANLLFEGDNTGVIDKETSSMLERTIRFGSLSVKRIMTPFKEIDSVDLSLDEEKFFDLAVETSRSRIPVYLKTKENIIGYVHINDILACRNDNGCHYVRNLVKPPYYVYEDMKINDLLKEFQTGKTHMAFVKDVNDNISGIITLEDILEEVVGEILDEYEFDR